MSEVKGLTAEEMDNMFETLYNNIGSNQAPGLNAYEKSVFLTKAQDEIVKNYFNPKSKGNNLQEGFDGSQKRQIDFSMLTTVWVLKEYTPSVSTASSQVLDSDGNVVGAVQATLPGGDVRSVFKDPMFDDRSNSRSVTLPSDLMMAINEMVEVIRGTSTNNVTLQVVALKYDEYTRLMSKPYKRPLKYQAWRLLNSDTQNKADIVIGPSDTLTKYTLRYIRRPKPIIVSNLDGLTIQGEEEEQSCELDPILHEEIVQRAVELAKAAWTSTGQDNIQMMMQAGQRSE